MKTIVEKIIYEPWPWYIGGPLIGLFTLVLLLTQRKQLGISSSFEYICYGISPVKLKYLKKNFKKGLWQFYFIGGMVIGGTVLSYFVQQDSVAISAQTIETLSQIGVKDFSGFVPADLFNFSSSSVLVILTGGILIGFGARYANGCTAGHAIMGSAQLAKSSLIATAAFFLGGLAATYFIIPNLF